MKRIISVTPGLSLRVYRAKTNRWENHGKVGGLTDNLLRFHRAVGQKLRDLTQGKDK